MILHLPLDYFYPLGGAEISLIRLTSYLNKKGLEQCVVCRGDRDTTVDGVNVYSFKNMRTKTTDPIRKKTIPLLEANIHCTKKILEVVRKEDIELIHIWYTLPFGLPGILAKKILKIPSILTLAGMDISDPYISIPKPIRELQKYIIKESDEVICVSNFVKQKATELCRKDMNVAYLGIDLNMWGKRTDLNLKEKYNCDFLVIIVARLVKIKGLEYLIHSVPDVIKEVNAKFIILGEGENEGYLKKLSHRLGMDKSVIFCGSISNRELVTYYHEADLFVLPSLHESFGLVFLEAMACGLPIVSTDVGAIPEVVGDAGILVRPKDATALSKAILKILKNEGRRKELTQNGKRRVEEFTIEKQGNFYYELIKGMI